MSFPLLKVPDDVIIEILRNLQPELLFEVSLTCKALKNFIENKRNQFESKKIHHIDLDRRRVRAWRDASWCDRIPFQSFDYISAFFRNISVKVLTVNTLDEEICDFLLLHAKKHRLRFEQLRLFHSLSASKESISKLLHAAGCHTVNFEAVQSSLNVDDLKLLGFRNLNALCFEMDDSIGDDFFSHVLEVSKATKFIFHGCDRISQEFIGSVFQKWKNGSRKFNAVRITTNQNISFDAIVEKLDGIEQLNHFTWRLINNKGDRALITMRRNSFHFFVAFEVNDCHVEDILYKIPMIES